MSNIFGENRSGRKQGAVRTRQAKKLINGILDNSPAYGSRSSGLRCPKVRPAVIIVP